MQRVVHKLATGLVLVALLLSGIAPGAGLVLCVEGDGTAGLELATSGCSTCPGADDSRPIGTDGTSELTACPCIDIPLPVGSEELRAKPKLPNLSSLVAAMPAAALGTPAFGSLERLDRFPPSPPRPRAGLELIRTVILRV